MYRKDTPPPIRGHVQAHYLAYDPFSPLGLVVPRGLTPPWRDVFVEGQVDIIHGGYLTNNVVLDARLRQCSRYEIMITKKRVMTTALCANSKPVECHTLWLLFFVDREIYHHLG